MSRPQVATWLSIEAAERWQQGQARRAVALATPTELMLELAGVAPGARVLDVAAGTGDQSLEAARWVGSSGYVLATDLSASMLELAACAAEDAGLSQLETAVGDAQELDLPPASFDAAICRLGLMFFPDRRKALRAIRRALKPGGRFAAMVWSAPERNPSLALPLAAAQKRLGDDESSAVAIALSMGQPEMLCSELQCAGFADVNVQLAPANRYFTSVAEALEAIRRSPAAEAAAQLPEIQQDELWREVHAQLQDFEVSGGCEVPGECLVGVGTSSA